MSLKFVVALVMLFAFSNTAAQEEGGGCTSNADCSLDIQVCIFPPGTGHGDGDNDSHGRLRARKLFGVERVIKGRCGPFPCLRQNKEWLNWYLFTGEIENPDRNKCPKYGGWVEWAKSNW